MKMKSELDEILENEERAKKLGVTPGHVSRVLSGQRNMTMKTLAKIGYALGIHPQLRLREEPPKAKQQRSGEGSSDWSNSSTGRVVLRESSMRKLNLESSNTDWIDPRKEAA